MTNSFFAAPTIGAFCTDVPQGVRTLLEAPGLTTTLLGETAVSPPVPKGSMPLFPLPPLNKAGGRVTTDTTRPTKRVSVGAEAVDAPLCTCIKRNDSTVGLFPCWFFA